MGWTLRDFPTSEGHESKGSGEQQGLVQIPLHILLLGHLVSVVFPALWLSGQLYFVEAVLGFSHSSSSTLHPSIQTSADQRQQNPEKPVQDWSSQKHSHSHPARASVCTPEGTALAQPALLPPHVMDHGVTADLLHRA